MVLLISFPAALGRELDQALSGSPDPPDSIARVKSLKLTSKNSINAPRNGASERNTRYIQSSHALERVFCAGSSRDMAGEIAVSDQFVIPVVSRSARLVWLNQPAGFFALPLCAATQQFSTNGPSCSHTLAFIK